MIPGSEDDDVAIVVVYVKSSYARTTEDAGDLHYVTSPRNNHMEGVHVLSSKYTEKTYALIKVVYDDEWLVGNSVGKNYSFLQNA